MPAVSDTGSSRKRVMLAEPRGFCAGVRRAVAIVEQALERYGPPVYVRKEIVHNRHVIEVLRRQGARFVTSEEEVPEGALCVFSAHGVSPAVRENARGRRLDVIDATCPLVSKVHQEAQRFAREGRTIVLIGHADHEEVEGTRGEAPDRTIVVESIADVGRLDLPADTPVAYLTQTTLSIDDTAGIVAALRSRFADIRGPGSDDICYASQNRQAGVKHLAKHCELVLVVGATNSSNSQRMVDVARGCGTRAHLLPDERQLRTEWLAGVQTVGVSSGASVPDILVRRLLDRLATSGYVEVEVAATATEDVAFNVPVQLGGTVTMPKSLA